MNLGLGPTWAVSLVEAREIALANHRIAREGGDPRSRGAPTFAEAAETVIAIHAERWRAVASPRSSGGSLWAHTYSRR